MRTHPDIGLVIADLLQLARFWLCMIKQRFQLVSREFLFAVAGCMKGE